MDEVEGADTVILCVSEMGLAVEEADVGTNNIGIVNVSTAKTKTGGIDVLFKLALD